MGFTNPFQNAVDQNYTTGFGSGSNCYTPDGSTFYSSVVGAVVNTYIDSAGVIYDLFYLATTADEGPILLTGGPKLWTKTQRLTGSSIMSISVADYGASPAASAAVNDAAFAAATAVLTQGQRLIIPNGEHTINNWVWNPPNECVLDCYGVIASATTGTAVQIGKSGSGNQRFRWRINGLKVKRPGSSPRDITVGSEAIRIIHTLESIIDIRQAEGFETGVKGWGTHYGCSYNHIFLGRIVDNKFGVFLDHDGSGLGWWNENIFYGGRFSWTTSVTDGTGHIHVLIGNRPPEILNDNRFLYPSFEAVDGSWNSGGTLKGKAVVLNGSNNTIDDCRLEFTNVTTSSKVFEIAAECIKGTINIGDGGYLDMVNNLATAGSGHSNRYSAVGARRYASIDTVSPALAIQAENANTQKLWQGRNISNAMTSEIDAAGKAVFSQVVLSTVVTQGIFVGSDSPETVVTAYQGSIYLNNNNNETRIWVKGSGADALNWCEHIGARVVNTNQAVPNGPGCRLTYFMNCNGAAKTVTFPLTTNCKGMIITVVKTDAGAFNVTTPLTGGDVIFGGAVVLAAQGAKITYESDGAGTWWQI